LVKIGDQVYITNAVRVARYWEKATIPAIMGAGEYFRARLCDDPKTEGARAWLPRVVTPVLLFSAD